MEEADNGNSFLELLSQLGKGRVLTELAEAERKCVLAVREAGGKATLTLKLVFDPIKRTEGEQLDVRDEIKTTLPKPARPATLFFTDEEGQLSRNHPTQRDWVEEAKAKAKLQAIN